MSNKFGLKINFEKEFSINVLVDVRYIRFVVLTVPYENRERCIFLII